MTIAEWCVFGTLMLYLLTIASDQVDRISPLRQCQAARSRLLSATRSASRALGAHQNGIEAFPFFAVAVLLAEFRAGPQRLIDELAVLFLIVRIAYVFTYLGNRPTLRSILWSVGFAINSRDLLPAGDPRLLAGLRARPTPPQAASGVSSRPRRRSSASGSGSRPRKAT